MLNVFMVERLLVMRMMQVKWRVTPPSLQCTRLLVITSSPPPQVRMLQALRNRSPPRVNHLYLEKKKEGNVIPLWQSHGKCTNTFEWYCTMKAKLSVCLFVYLQFIIIWFTTLVSFILSVRFLSPLPLGRGGGRVKYLVSTLKTA